MGCKGSVVYLDDTYGYVSELKTKMPDKKTMSSTERSRKCREKVKNYPEKAKKFMRRTGFVKQLAPKERTKIDHLY